MQNKRRAKTMNNPFQKNTMKKVLISLCFLLSGMFVSAQKTNEDVIIIDAYKPTISDAFKINENPKITDTVVKKPELNYSITSKAIHTSFDVEPIKPAKMIGEPLTKLYKSYIKLGFGNKTTPLGEVYFNNLRSTNQTIGFYFNHLSSSGKIKDYAFPGFSDNNASIYASRYFRNHTLSADINYFRNVVHYYGYKPDEYVFEPLSKDDIKQRFLKVGGELSYFSTYSDSSKLNHAFKLKYYNLSDLYDAMEDYLYFKGSINKKVEFLGKNFSRQMLGLNAIVDLYNDNRPSDTLTEGTIKLQPFLSATYSILKMKAALNIVFEATDNSKAKINPDLSLDLNIANNVFVIFAGYRSDQYRNNLIDLANENPFINTKLPLGFSNKKSEIYGGIKGSLSSYLSYNAYVSKSKIENMPLFVNDTTYTLQNRFTVTYDTVKVFNTHTEIAFQKTEKYKLMLVSNFYQYFTSHELEAWHKPNMDIKLAFNYNLKNKIISKIEIFAFNRVYAKSYSPDNIPKVVPVTLKGTVDVNLGVEYRYSKILSGFLNFNNIGAVKYQRWNNYPSYGFTIMGGITYAL
jgi:hypothetical protein